VGKGNRIGLVALMAAGALASCGGSESEPLTKKELLRQGNTICAKFQQEREELAAEYVSRLQGNEASNADMKEALIELVERHEEASANLRELNPPEADEAKVKRIVAEMQAAADRAHRNPLGEFSGSNFFTKANEEAKAYGFNQCVF